MAGEWTEIRGMVLPGDGEALIVMLGPAAVMPMPAAGRALEGPGPGALSGRLTWRPPWGYQA